MPLRSSVVVKSLRRRAPEVESAAFAVPSRANAGRRSKKSTQGRSSNAAPCALASPLPVYVDDEFQDCKALGCTGTESSRYV
eukprot:Skav208809  [mRNA]  locus=scaffold349:185995:188354:- [translate_table: standard]